MRFGEAWRGLPLTETETMFRMDAERGEEKSVKTFARMGKSYNRGFFTVFGLGRGREWLQDMLDKRDGHWYDYVSLPYDWQNRTHTESASKCAK